MPSDERKSLAAAKQNEQDKKKLKYRWINSVTGFDMPVEVVSNGQKIKITPSEKWQTIKLNSSDKIEINQNYYVIPDRLSE